MSLKRYEKHGRLNDTWRLLSPADPSVLPHVASTTPRVFLARNNMPFATEAGRISSKPFAEVSRQLQIASSALLFEYRAPHWQLFTSTNDRWTFVRDRLRHHDISGLFVQVPRGGGSTSSLRALSKVAIDLRVPAAFLIRGYASVEAESWIDPRKPDEQTTVNLHLCCFGSRAFSPCTVVFQGCSRERLGTFALGLKLRCYGRSRVLQFSPGQKHLETRLVSRIKSHELSVDDPSGHLVSVLMTAG